LHIFKEANMFNRRDASGTDRANERSSGQDRAASNTRAPGEPQRTIMPSVPAMQYTGAMPEPADEAPIPPQAEPSAQPTETVIARDDTFEGQLRTSKGVRILGTVRGAIESATYVYIEANALVEADISASEVVIGGEYSGNLNCRQRVEIQSTGRVRGRLDTVKLHLHEGGYFDGELHMQKPPEAGERARTYTSNDNRLRRPRFTDVTSENNTNREISSADPAS
jgi:cytoskeletal protein CcmA (bactofilin family)